MGELIDFKPPKGGARAGPGVEQSCVILVFTGVWRERTADPGEPSKPLRRGAARRPGKRRDKARVEDTMSRQS